MRRRGWIESLKLSINPRCRILPRVAEEADSTRAETIKLGVGGRQYELVRCPSGMEVGGFPVVYSVLKPCNLIWNSSTPQAGLVNAHMQGCCQWR